MIGYFDKIRVLVQKIDSFGYKFTNLHSFLLVFFCISICNRHQRLIILLDLIVPVSNIDSNVLVDMRQRWWIFVCRRWYIFVVLDHQRNEIWWVFQLVPSYSEHRFWSFECHWKYYVEVVLNYLFCSVPHPSAWRCKSNILPFNEVNTADWTYIHKVFEADVAETQSLDLKAHSLRLFRLPYSDKSIGQNNLIDFLLYFLAAGDNLYTFGLLQKMVIEITLQHEVVFIDFLQLFH